MFVGSINQDVRAILAELAPRWRDRPVYVGCSGNLTVERVLLGAGVREVHGNDVSLYSCALGRYLAGDPLTITVKDETFDWLAAYLEPGLPSIATLMLCTEYLKFAGRDERYHRRMAAAYEQDCVASAGTDGRSGRSGDRR